MKSVRNDIVLILPFYGKLPWYFDFFLRSLEGKSFDMLFVSDLAPDWYPSNFHILKLDFTSLSKLINEKLDTNVTLKNTYKLCDYKPMYGKIFEDYIKDYHYWAFGDCDLIYGNSLNGFLEEVVPKYDVVSLRRHWLSGPFTILRNTNTFVTFYKKATMLNDVFTNDKYMGFDELGGYWFYELEAGRMTMKDCEQQKDYFTATVFREQGIKFYHENIIGEDNLAKSIVEMRDGHLFYDGQEIPVFHYINVKRHAAFRKNWSLRNTPPRDYIVTKAGIYSSFLGRHCWRLIGMYRSFFARLRGYCEYSRKEGVGALIKHFLKRAGLV